MLAVSPAGYQPAASPGVSSSSLCRRETVAFDLDFFFFMFCSVPGGYKFWFPRTSLHGFCLMQSQDACAVQQVTLRADALLQGPGLD